MVTPATHRSPWWQLDNCVQTRLEDPGPSPSPSARLRRQAKVAGTLHRLGRQVKWKFKWDRCLPSRNTKFSLAVSCSVLGGVSEPQNRSTSAVAIISANETLPESQLHPSNKAINKHQPVVLLHNVLCNSRCQCVILDPSDDDQMSAQTQGNDTSMSSARGGAKQQTPAEQNTNADKQPRSTTAAAASASGVEQTLIAFSEDYSLDYSDSAPVLQPEQGDGNGPQQSPAPPTPLNGTVASSADLRPATNSSSSSAGSTTRIAGRSNEPTLRASGADLNSGRPYAAISQQQPIISANNTAPTNKTADEAGASVVAAAAAAAAAAAKRQPVVPQAATQPQPPLFPLHHLHHHLHHGAAGSGGRDSNGPQLYAQSLYSSQAPKLSYHAHAPYLKTPSSPSSPPSLSSSSTSQQQQQTSGEPAPPGAAMQPHHHMRATAYLAAANQRLRPVAGRKDSPSAVKRLIPLRSLRMDGKLAQRNATTPQQLAQILAKMLCNIDEQTIQSLSLRDNELEFELYSELYALLATNLHSNLYHLDLSHNSIAKLGLTFTGHLEHHLVVHGTWPFANSSASPAATDQQQQQQPANDIIKPSGGQAVKSKAERSGRHSALLSGEKLYSLVKRILNNSNPSNDSQVQSRINNVTNAQLQQPMQLRALDLSHNKLKWLINDQFRALKHVHSIRLDYNRIRYIHQHAFSGLESLRFLNLNFNRLQVIYIEQFQTNFNLLALMLRSNYLAYLRGGSFASQVNLRRLDLSQNKLTIVSNNAFVGLESLEVLNCSSNQFVHAPTASLHSLTNLRQLDLSDNLLAQLAPGTFFHLPIEELWLERNEQLVSIDRGAFWDLPYLRYLHLGANPMLASINAQAFVGSQNLQRIDTDDCPSLEPSARHLLDNITSAAASRLLRFEQSRQNHTLQEPQGATMHSQAPAPVELPAKMDNETIVSKHSGKINGSQLQITAAAAAASANKTVLLKYFYYLATITSLAVALKLVFKYTSTSHFMEARRRRRRVYGESQVSCGDSSELDSSSSSAAPQAESSSVSSYEMCAPPGQGPGEQHQHVIGAVIHRISDESLVRHSSPRASVSSSSGIFDRQQEQQQQVGLQQQDGDQCDNNSNSNDDDNVIISSNMALAAHCCPECPSGVQVADAGGQGLDIPVTTDQTQQQQQQQQQQASTIDLIHSQLIAAGFDYGHANCAHFYQSLGPALQLADMTANFVNGMDYY